MQGSSAISTFQSFCEDLRDKTLNSIAWSSLKKDASGEKNTTINALSNLQLWP